MIKWLTNITVQEGESQDYYHFHDNKVLPSHVRVCERNRLCTRSYRFIITHALCPSLAIPVHLHRHTHC